MIASNIEEYNGGSFTTYPLEGDNKKSDHLPLVCQYLLPSSHCFKIVKYKTRKYTKKNEDKFVAEFKDTNWTGLFELSTANEKTAFLHERIELLMNKYFPLKTYSVKSTDDPWITDHLRKEMRKRNIEYKKNGKSERFLKLKAEILSLIHI